MTPMGVIFRSAFTSQEEAPRIASLVVSEVRAPARAQQPLPDDEPPIRRNPAHPAVGDSRDSLAVSTVSQQRR
jgi:hypothetical protein